MKKLSLMIVIMLSSLFLLTGCKSSDYKTAQEDIEKGNYDEAITILYGLGDYKDSKALLESTLDRHTDLLAISHEYDKAIDLCNKYSSLFDYSDKIAKYTEEKATYSIYSDAISKINSGSISAGLDTLKTLPKDYLNVDQILSSYNDLSSCRFKGKHVNKDGVNDIRQELTFTTEFDEKAEKFVLHAYKAVYWSDGSVYKDYDYILNSSDIVNNTISVGKFKWEASASGSITETEKSETYYYP